MSWMAHFSSGMFHPRYLHLPRSPFALQKFQHKIWCGSRKISLTLSLSGNWPVHSSRLSLSHSHPKRESMSKSPWWHDVRTCRRTKFSRKSHFRALWICPPLSSLAIAKQVEAAGEEYIMSRKHFPDLLPRISVFKGHLAKHLFPAVCSPYETGLFWKTPRRKVW